VADHVPDDVAAVADSGSGIPATCGVCNA